MTLSAKDQSRLQAMKNIVKHIAETIDGKFSIQLWDGSMIPLGENPEPGFYLSISGPGVMGSLLRKPTFQYTYS